ncbi:uncharacterized protein N0V89_001698 [Didymosphaeria variabile]|uniref:Ankyrin n=1 Tax=Didymosphaeria variabile TaxID=1932322 RepID=A0A9W9CGX4_9PLEO|nr:uncharacterized protein N0V89_001698 [Didymosphaeria variabile]KAJ4361129.1 hypothetical protein N0V89_001698 [Didymosphaeria variabile]
MFQKEMFQKWGSSRNTPFLALRNVENVHLTCQAVFNQVVMASSWSGMCHRFDCRHSDLRMKTVGDILCTVLKETLSKSSHATHSPDELGWDLRDLFNVYREVALMNQSDEEVWILLNFNESIDSSAWLLDTLYDLAANSDLHFRVIFINNPDSTLRLDSEYTTFLDRTDPEQRPPDERSSSGPQSPPKAPVSTSEQTKDLISEGEDVPDEITRYHTQSVLRKAERRTLEVIQKSPWVAPVGLELFKLFQTFDVSEKHKEMIMRWLANLPVSVCPTAMQEQISNISDSRIESTFKLILSLDPLALSKPDSTISILELVALAFRPLTYLELADLEEARKSWETGYISQVMQPTSIFSVHPGVFNLLGNEVHFGHPEFRSYLLSGDSLLLDLEAMNLPKRHSLFVRLCLEYLTSSHGLNRLEVSIVSSDDVGAPESRMDFLSYAVQFWPKHASLACSEWSPEDSVAQKFLSNTLLLDLWGRVYWHRTSSATRPSLERSGPLATLIEFAPESTLQATLAAHKGTEWIKGQYFNALLAAARGGKSDTVSLLLQDQSLDSGMFDLALQAALKSQDETTISMITSEAPQTYPCSVAIPTALRKALEIGQESVTNRLLPLISWETIEEDNKKSILAAAISGNNVDIANDLLERFQGTQARDISEAVLQAVRNGHAALSSVLMAHLLKLLKEEERHTTLPGLSATTVNGVEDELTTSNDSSNLKRLDALDTGEAQVPVESRDAGITTNEQEDATGVILRERSEESAASPPADSYYAEVVLSHAIDHGQHNVIKSLVEVLRNNHSFPTSIKPLLETAIVQCRPRCLSTILKLCENISPQSKLDKNELLDLAASRGNVAVINQLLQGFVVLDDESFPEVFQSAMKRSPATPDVVQLFIERGRNCVTPDTFVDQLNNMEPAIDNRSTEIVKLLVSAGAQLDKRSISGSGTPLYDATYQGRVEIVETLIKAGADVNIFEDDDEGWWPVHAAFDNPQIMKLLLAHGANVNARTCDGDTALYLATKWGYEDCVAEILKHKPELNCLIRDSTILFRAVDGDELGIAGLLLDAGEDPCHPATKAANALLLHECVENEHVDLLKRLLLYNFDLEHVDELGRTALNCLSSAKDIPTLRLLLRRGANIETQDVPWNDTPLSNSVRLGDVELTSFLISEGVNTNATIGRYHESTPLLLACGQCLSRDILRVLVDNGANTKIVSEGVSGTMFQTVCQSAHDSREEVISYLLENDLVDVELTSNWWGSNLNTACLMTDPDVVDKLIKRGADVDAVDRAGRRPVHFALYRTIEHVNTLCDRDDGKNADLFALDHMERNALHFAVISGRLNLVQHIIERRPGLAKGKDCDGWTPLFWAVRDAFKWNVDTSERAAIIEALVKDGADIMDVVEGLPHRWATYQVARYYGLDNDIIKLVTPTEEQVLRSDLRAFWYESLAAESRTARRHDDSFCDICLLGLVGVFFKCTECRGFAICFKCYWSRNRNLVHDPHPFESRYEDDEYEDGGNEGPAPAGSEHPDSTDSPVASEASDSDSEDEAVRSDSDNSSFS